MIVDVQFDNRDSKSKIENLGARRRSRDFSGTKSKIAGRLYLPDPVRFSPPYPGVVVCHGIGSCKENQSSFDKYLAERGMAVLGFDFRGHGASEGELDEHTLDDVLAALNCLAERPEVDAARLALRGSSMGAFFALRAAACDLRVRAVAAIAPAVDSNLVEGLESGYLQHLLEREQMHVRVNVPSFSRAIRAQETRSVVARLEGRSLFFIQCRGDELVPVAWTQELYALAPEPKKLLLIDGGHHRYAQEDQGVHQAIYDWFRVKMDH